MEAEKRLLINISVRDALCRNRTTTSSGIGWLRSDINPLLSIIASSAASQSWAGAKEKRKALGRAIAASILC